jgi:hypothetical protein
MVIGGEFCCFGARLENRRFSDPTFLKRPRSKFIWLWKTYELCNQGRRVMPIIAEEN